LFIERKISIFIVYDREKNEHRIWRRIYKGLGGTVREKDERRASRIGSVVNDNSFLQMHRKDAAGAKRKGGGEKKQTNKLGFERDKERIRTEQSDH